MPESKSRLFARCFLGFAAALLFLAAPGILPSSAASSGSVVAWGDNEYGELGNNARPPFRITPGAVLAPGGTGNLTGVQAISAGDLYSLALKQDGSVWAWGYNGDGQLGDGTTTDRHIPVQVVGPGGAGFLTGVTAVASWGYNSLALKQDGTVWGWGYNQYGGVGDGTNTDRHIPTQVVGPGGAGFLTGVAAVSTGDSHSVALKQDGTLWAWGDNTAYGALGDGTTISRNTPVQVLGPGGAGFLTGVTSVSLGLYFNLAVKQDGTVWAWGQNQYGALGDGTTTDRLTPVQVLGPGGAGFLTGVVSVSAGEDFSLALKQDGTVWAWGFNAFGELGDGTVTDRHVPVQVVGPGGAGFLTGVVAVSAGGHSLALKQDGTAWAWGTNNYGQLGDGTTTDRHTPVQVVDAGGAGFLTDVTAVSAGFHSMALNHDGAVLSWGFDYSGQLGDGKSGASSLPVETIRSAGSGPLVGVTAVSAGYYHSLALKQDGTVWAWGYNWDGELGDGTTVNRLTPVQVLGPGGAGFLTDVIAVSAGDYHSVALKRDGTVWAWGYNYSGDLGDGTTTERHVPVQVVGPGGVGFLTGVTSIATGFYPFSLALKQDGTVWAWGTNNYGQLGDGTTTDRHVPVQVVGPGGAGFLTGVLALSPGGIAVLKQDGTVWAWGYNYYGALGDGTHTDRHTPVQVVGPGGTGFLTGITAVSAGFNNGLALKQDGTVWAWGYNWDGELGDGTTTTSFPYSLSSPVQVVGPDGAGFLTGVTAISEGLQHSLALKQDGTVWAWGYNGHGELGDGAIDADPHPTPAQVVGRNSTGFLQRVTAISAGPAHNLVILAHSPPFDFNADSQADLLWQNQATGGVTAWLMNGAQYSGSGSSVVDSASWKVVGVADFNGDGSPDLVWQNPTNGAVYVWYMNGLQYSGTGGSIVDAADSAWKVVGTPDLNGDGHPDILWQNTSTGGVYYWLMNGTQYTGQGGYIVTTADPAWKVVATPDLNGDGSPDILWQNSTTGSIIVWYMNGVAYSGVGATIVASTDPAWKIVGVPDLNGDGQPDMLWQNSTTGGVYYWLMNGALYTGQEGAIASSTALNWQIVGIH